MFKPVNVTPLPGSKIRVQYSDGVEGDVDLSHLVGKGVFSLWNDPNAFEKVRIGPGGEIRWSDEVDLCPDALYMEIIGKTPEEILSTDRERQSDPSHHIETNQREGWEEAFAHMTERGDDQLLDLETPTEWDKTEWEW